MNYINLAGPSHESNINMRITAKLCSVPLSKKKFTLTQKLTRQTTTTKKKVHQKKFAWLLTTAWNCAHGLTCMGTVSESILQRMLQQLSSVLAPPAPHPPSLWSHFWIVKLNCLGAICSISPVWLIIMKWKERESGLSFFFIRRSSLEIKISMKIS